MLLPPRLLEHFELLSDQVGRHQRSPRDVSPRARQARHEPAPQRIIDGHHDDRDRPGRLLGGPGRRSTHRHDDVHLRTDQAGHEGGQPIILSLRPLELEGDALTFHVAEIAQGLAEGFETALSSLVGLRTRRQITYARRLLWTLGRSRAK